MARNQEKANLFLNRIVNSRADELRAQEERRPWRADEVKDIDSCEVRLCMPVVCARLYLYLYSYLFCICICICICIISLCNHTHIRTRLQKWRRQVLNEITKLVGEIQNGSMGEHLIRDINDKINKRLNERHHWEKQIAKLGGNDYGRLRKMKQTRSGGWKGKKGGREQQMDADGNAALCVDGYFYFGRCTECGLPEYDRVWNVMDDICDHLSISQALPRSSRACGSCWPRCPHRSAEPTAKSCTAQWTWNTMVRACVV
jgi:hypothetical protein